MLSALTPMCPAIPAIFYQPHPVWHHTLVSTALELLEQHQAVTITGMSKHYWDLNKQIGKTTAVKNRLIPNLRKGGRTVSYMNIQKLVMKRWRIGSKTFRYTPLLRKASALREADVYIIDEIQHTFPFERGIRNYESKGEPYSSSMIRFWEQLGKRLEAGAKAVFVTVIHPLYINPNNEETKDMLVTEPMLTFFSSPVIELRGL